MTNILVPTDFSNGAKNALDFAALLAKQHKARLTLLHTFDIPYSSAPLSFEIIQEEQEQKTSDALAKMKLSCEQIQSRGIVCDYHVLEGDPGETIVSFVKEHPVDLIVMGTRNRKQIEDIYFGRTAAEVIEKSPCPVMSIPLSSKTIGSLSRVTYATDFLSSDLDAITLLTSWLQPFDAELCLVHVSTDPEIYGSDVNKISAFAKRVEEETGYRKLAFELLAGSDAEAELGAYITKAKSDLMVMSTTKRGVFGRILNASATKHFAETSEVPLIAFHHPRKERQMTL